MLYGTDARALSILRRALNGSPACSTYLGSVSSTDKIH
jgi:hypothetical protein